MGTSADLAGRFGGRTYFQHTSYDAQTENILASILSTWAACGTMARGYDKALIDAVVHLDEEAWTAIENSGRLLELLSEEIMTSAIGFAVFMATMFEEGWPGSTNERFQALSKSHQKIFLGNMEPIDRFLFAALIKENSTAKIAPKM